MNRLLANPAHVDPQNLTPEHVTRILKPLRRSEPVGIENHRQIILHNHPTAAPRLQSLRGSQSNDNCVLLASPRRHSGESKLPDT